MNRRRIILVLFGLLDAYLLGRFALDISLPPLPRVGIIWWFWVIQSLRPFFLLSLGVSAFGLAMEKQWGLILTYVQVPFRVGYVLLSFGFLTLITVPLLGPGAYQPTLIAALVLEGLRLVVTVLLHARLVRDSA